MRVICASPAVAANPIGAPGGETIVTLRGALQPDAPSLVSVALARTAYVPAADHAWERVTGTPEALKPESDVVASPQSNVYLIGSLSGSAAEVEYE